MADCIFCAIVAREAPAQIHHNGLSAIIIEPLNPVTDGHLLVIPKAHVADALEDPDVTAATMHTAARWTATHGWANRAEYGWNFITSVGEQATQSVMHLHIHIVPRTHGDGLHLPWTDQYEHRPEGSGQT